jgi:hypothetical protein
MSIYNINNENILVKLRLLKVCNKDDFASQVFNFLLLEDCLNIATQHEDFASLEVLKNLIDPYIANLNEHMENVELKDFKFSDHDLCDLDEKDALSYDYKLKNILMHKSAYFVAFANLLKS